MKNRQFLNFKDWLFFNDFYTTNKALHKPFTIKQFQGCISLTYCQIIYFYSRLLIKVHDILLCLLHHSHDIHNASQKKSQPYKSTLFHQLKYFKV